MQNSLNLTTVTIAIGLVSWQAPARLTRAEHAMLIELLCKVAGRTTP